MATIACPKCQSPRVARISVRDPGYQFGESRCQDCGFHDDWGLFFVPPLQMSLPFGDAHPNERVNRVLHQATIAVREMLSPPPRSAKMERFLPNNAVLKALLKGDVSVDELTKTFHETLVELVQHEKSKANASPMV